MYKNQLQEFAQKSVTSLPVYETVNTGQAHAPQFRSTVLVDGLKFTSPGTFFNRKAAEQDAAKLAVESICRKIEEESLSLIHEDKRFCKSILYEYAVKMSHAKPTYRTCQAEGILPVFTSSITYNGQAYTGHPAKNKKEAEQMVAHAVIESILARSNTRTLMGGIICSKRKLYAAFCTAGGSSSLSSVSAPVRRHNNPNDVVKGKEVIANLTTNMLPKSMCSGNEQIAKAIATKTACELSFEDEGSGRSQVTFPEDSSLAVIASGTSNSNDGSPSHENINNGAKKIGPSPRPEGSPGLVLTRGREQPDATDNEESESKKSRTTEQFRLPTAAADPYGSPKMWEKWHAGI